jgi:hypothetical protein
MLAAAASVIVSRVSLEWGLRLQGRMRWLLSYHSSNDARSCSNWIGLNGGE